MWVFRENGHKLAILVPNEHMLHIHHFNDADDL